MQRQEEGQAPSSASSKWVPVSAADVLLSALGLATAEQLKRMVEEDRDISVPGFLRPLVARAVAEFIVRWLGQVRPDLAEVLATEKGKRWLARQVSGLMRG